VVPKECQHQVEPDPAEMAARYGAETTVLDWRGQLVCSQCGSRQVDMVVTGGQAIGPVKRGLARLLGAVPAAAGGGPSNSQAGLVNPRLGQHVGRAPVGLAGKLGQQNAFALILPQHRGE
jgi:hypothetical protein